MFTKNIFTQKDSIADIIKDINEADYKAKMEELKGGQKKIDKNHNNKIDADDFKILRGEKKAMKEEEEVEESNNPFDVKNYKSQLKTKPGEKAGFDSKKISTGTVYTRKPVKDEPMKKEEIDPNDTTTDTLKGREKTSNNKFLSKKVMMDVPGNVNEEEIEQIDELEFTVEDFENFMQTEEFEQLDELSKKLVDRYYTKAVNRHYDVLQKDLDKGVEHQKIRSLMAKTNKVAPGIRAKNPLHSNSAAQAALKAASDAIKKDREPAKKEMEKRSKGIAKAYAKLHGGKDREGKKVVRATGKLTKEDYEQVDEFYGGSEPEMTHHKLVDGKPNVPKKVGSKDIHLHHIGTGNPTGENAKYKVVAVGSKSPLKAKVGSTISGRHVNDHMDDGVGGGRVHIHTARPKSHFMDEEVAKEDVEQVDEANSETKQEFLARQQRLAAAHSETQKDPKRLARLMKIPGYSDAMKLAQKTTQKEEVEQMDERTLTKGETSEKERIVKGMKKSLAGFKSRYGDRAKSVMYATATKAAKKD
jgi:hypothetical protein